MLRTYHLVENFPHFFVVARPNQPTEDTWEESAATASASSEAEALIPARSNDEHLDYLLENHDVAFKNFMQKYGKRYSFTELAIRQQNHRNCLTDAKARNKAAPASVNKETHGETEFCDMSKVFTCRYPAFVVSYAEPQDEFKQSLLGFKEGKGAKGRTGPANANGHIMQVRHHGETLDVKSIMT